MHQFEQYKDLFKDISEIISRQFVLIAGINNLQNVEIKMFSFLALV
jgi:hypothetical protein